MDREKTTGISLHENGNYIPVKTKKETTRIFVGDILYIESERRVLFIYTEKRDYRFYSKLDEVVKYLNECFYRCHKSCMVNLDKVERMDDGVIYFPDGRQIRIGQNNYQLARGRYFSFLEQNNRRNRGLTARVSETEEEYG